MLLNYELNTIHFRQGITVTVSTVTQIFVCTPGSSHCDWCVRFLLLSFSINWKTKRLDGCRSCLLGWKCQFIPKTVYKGDIEIFFLKIAFDIVIIRRSHHTDICSSIHLSSFILDLVIWKRLRACVSASSIPPQACKLGRVKRNLFMAE